MYVCPRCGADHPEPWPVETTGQPAMRQSWFCDTCAAINTSKPAKPLTAAEKRRLLRLALKECLT